MGRAAGRSVDPKLLAFLTLAYSAFRLGRATLAAQLLDGPGGEAARLHRRVEDYAGRLARHVAATC
ncbi:MAG: hypothetical protein JWO81_1655 [Alphaproteobacteria bacterium]|nr:hypothetical protein [Alphaproteobacteria bacterium]